MRAVESALTPCAAGAALLCVAACAGPGEGPGGGALSAADSAGIRAAEAAYVEAWGANDPEAVLATLTRDPVLIPGGAEPVVGLAAVRAFWWPPEGPATTVTRYESSIDELGGNGDMAWARGRGEVAFTWEQDGESRDATSRAAYLMILRRDASGEWRISRRMWAAIDG